MRIAKDTVVTLDYTMYDVENEILESSERDGVLVYLHGIGELPDGLETQLEGKQAGDELGLTLTPEEGYGEYDEELVEAVPLEEFEGIGELEIGMRLEAETEDGPQVLRVIGFEEEDVILDGNEVYAGQTLRFEIKVLGVRAASPEEIEHGHVHGAGCDHDHDEDIEDEESDEK